MEADGQHHAPDPGERAPGVHWIRRWMGPNAYLHAVNKNPLFLSAVAHHLARSLITELFRLHKIISEY
jgi:hypothetical protein